MINTKTSLCIAMCKMVVAVLLTGYSICLSQPATFMKMYNKGNVGYCVREVNGNSYVIAGGTDFYYNYHWQIMSQWASSNIHFFKTDDRGNLLWEKIYGNLNSRTIARWTEPTSDGGYILTGHDSRDVNWPNDSNDVVLVKTDANGAITWSKIYNTGRDELAFCVQQTADDGYIVSGFHDALPISLAGNTYALLLKTDDAGNVSWVKKFQFAVRDLATAEPFPFVVRQTANGGYIIVGTTASSNAADVYVIRTDMNGDLVWANSYDHDNTVFRFSTGLDVIESASGDFIIAGSMDKNRALNQNNHPYIIKLSSTGVLLDAHFYETNPLLMFQSGFSSVQQTADGGFFFNGMGGYSGFGDQAQLLQTDVNFNTQWSRVYSWDGLATMGSRSGRQTSDGYYVFTGKRQFAGTVLMKVNDLGLIPCKIPNSLIEHTPSLITQNKVPLALPGISVNNFPLTVQNPLVDTSVICSIITLPVELIYFTATAVNEGQVQLEWITASETNNDYFAVERSDDGKHFTKVGIVNGGGNSTTSLNYSFDDDGLRGESLIYYRLKQVDFDGESHYSKTVAAKIHKESFEISIAFADYENKQVTAFVYSNSDQSLEYRITDVMGSTIAIRSTSVVKGVNEINIPADNLSQGVYYFSAGCGNRTVCVKLFY